MIAQNYCLEYIGVDNHSISKLENPIILSKYKIDALANDILIKSNFAYVSAINYGSFVGCGLYIFDISNLYEPNLISYNFIKDVSGVDIYEGTMKIELLGARAF